VLLDAFVVRMTIVPAVMALFGRRAWALPRWLDRLLPNIDVEGEKLRHTLDQQQPGQEQEQPKDETAARAEVEPTSPARRSAK
jgi:RND superfamily putative drug exporter